MWIQLLIPRIEDGNNFGVSIQVQRSHIMNRVVGSLIVSEKHNGQSEGRYSKPFDCVYSRLTTLGVIC